MKFFKCCFPRHCAPSLQAIQSPQYHIHLLQEKFPPNIYYKIYTYRPVTDVNSFAPRDYTVSNWAAPGATVKNSRVKNPNDREGMYCIMFVLPAPITPYYLTYLLSLSLNHPLTYSLTHLLTQTLNNRLSLTCNFTHLLMY